MAGQGLHLDRATLAGWVKRAAFGSRASMSSSAHDPGLAARVLRRDADAGARSRTTSPPHLPVLGASHG
nr:hypothetical protein [Bradyrhizobium sp. 188]